MVTGTAEKTLRSTISWNKIWGGQNRQVYGCLSSPYYGTHSTQGEREAPLANDIMFNWNEHHLSGGSRWRSGFAIPIHKLNY